MKILICGSVRFRTRISELMQKMEALGITPLFPNLDSEIGNKDKAINAAHKHRLALEHFEVSHQADAAYFLLPEGYMGTSVKIELGYVLAQSKPVYFSESTGEVDLDCYASAIIPEHEVEKLLHV